VKPITLYIFISIILFGISTFFRKLSLDRLHPYQLQVISGVIHAIFMPLWIYLLHKKGILLYNAVGINYAIICCLIYTVATVLFSFALQDSKNPGVISALISLSPIVTMLLAHFFLNEQFTWIKGLAFALALASVILLSL